MVNIQTVISINNECVITHSSFDAYWKANIETASSAMKQSKIDFKKTADRNAMRVAALYRVDPQRTKNICFIFGTMKETLKKILDYEMRQLLLDPTATVTLQYRAAEKHTMIIATFHLKTGFKILTNTINAEEPAAGWIKFFED